MFENVSKTTPKIATSQLFFAIFSNFLWVGYSNQIFVIVLQKLLLSWHSFFKHSRADGLVCFLCKFGDSFSLGFVHLRVVMICYIVPSEQKGRMPRLVQRTKTWILLFHVFLWLLRVFCSFFGFCVVALRFFDTHFNSMCFYGL